jgi:hypothetical protein
LHLKSKVESSHFPPTHLCFTDVHSSRRKKALLAATTTMQPTPSMPIEPQADPTKDDHQGLDDKSLQNRHNFLKIDRSALLTLPPTVAK